MGVNLIKLKNKAISKVLKKDTDQLMKMKHLQIKENKIKRRKEALYILMIKMKTSKARERHWIWIKLSTKEMTHSYKIYNSIRKTICNKYMIQ